MSGIARILVIFGLLIFNHPVSADSQEYQQLLQVYQQLVALNTQLQATTPPRGETGDKGGTGMKGEQGDPGYAGGDELSQEERDATTELIHTIYSKLDEGRAYLNAVKSSTTAFINRSEATIGLLDRLETEASLLETGGE